MTIGQLNPGDWFLYFFSKGEIAKDQFCLLLEHYQEWADLILFDNQGKCLGLRKLKKTVEVQYLGKNIKEVWDNI
jgi:hypothetical protein